MLQPGGGWLGHGLDIQRAVKTCLPLQPSFFCGLAFNTFAFAFYTLQLSIWTSYLKLTRLPCVTTFFDTSTGGHGAKS